MSRAEELDPRDEDIAPPPKGVTDHSPEARRKRAIRWRIGLEHVVEERVGPGTRFFTVLKRVLTGAYNDGFIHAGNLAYMAILALFPFFITVAAIFSLVGESEQQAASLSAFLTALPPVVTEVIEPVARNVMTARSGWVLWVGGLFGIWTVTSLVETIRDILHRAYGTPATLAFWRYRLLSGGLIISSVILLLLSLFAQVAITAADQVISAWFPALENVSTQLTLSRLVPAGMLYLSLYVLFLSLTPKAYRRAPYPKWPGALLVTVWWVSVTILLPHALRAFFNYDLTYGSLAGVMITLFFFWLVGLGMVMGAELNAALTETPEEQQMLDECSAGDRRETKNDGDSAK